MVFEKAWHTDLRTYGLTEIRTYGHTDGQTLLERCDVVSKNDSHLDVHYIERIIEYVRVNTGSYGIRDTREKVTPHKPRYILLNTSRAPFLWGPLSSFFSH